MSLDRFFKQLDVRYGIPRPASALHLDSYQAGLRLLRDTGEGVALAAAGVASSFIWWKIGEILLRVNVDFRPYILLVAIVCLLISFLEASSLAIPYYRMTQRVTHGSARWADVGTLKESGLAFDNRQALPPGALRIGRLTRKYDLALPFKQVLCHMAIFGPPGSGKSSSFFMSMARDWARRGSAIFLDPKGELFKYTARHFRRIYRLDLADPRLSDRWNFVPACKGDAELAHEIASIVVGFDFNKNYNGDPFWPQAETALMTSLLLHLPRIAENPTPAHVAEFIAARGFDQINHEMLSSPEPEARVQWGIFKKADREKTQGGVYIGLGTKLAPLRSPHAMAVMQSVTDEERERGLREIDLYDLRKPGTGIYVVVPEGDATRYKIALSILFGLAASVTRKTSDDEVGAPVLLALDEAGNIPLHNLSEALGVGRGRRCGIVLGYQNIGQLYKQHGRDGAQAILGSIGSMVFLPGLDAETAQYAAKRIGRTTVLQHTVVDATGNVFDNERLSEAGRDLLDAAELRQMPEHTQAVAIIGSAPPVKFGFPPCGKNGLLAHPLPREITRPVSLADAEEAFAMRRAEGATAEFSSDIGANLNVLPPDSRENIVQPDWSSEERLTLFDRLAESSGSHIAGVTFGPAEQMPFDWNVDSSGGRESIDSLIDSLLPLQPSSETKAVTGPPPAATDSVDTDDDVNSTLGSLSSRDFGGNAGTWAISGGEAGE
ncbi:MAG: type IV secretory system conjugative DNA transfer family protein [Acidobacteria bacterium]|nr:type IV secretory system conjugative DNA transfer family protein [Acidobacteriota bacterium]